MNGHTFCYQIKNLNLDVGLSALIDSLHGAIDHLAPEKTFQSKKSKPSWVDAEIELLTSEQVLFSENSIKMAPELFMMNFYNSHNLLKSGLKGQDVLSCTTKYVMPLKTIKTFGSKCMSLDCSPLWMMLFMASHQMNSILIFWLSLSHPRRTPLNLTNASPNRFSF